MKSIQELLERLAPTDELVTIGHPMIPQEEMRPVTHMGRFDMESALQAVADGALAGVAYDRVRPTETGHVFGIRGRLVYVDYGISDRAAAFSEFQDRLGRGMQIVDAHTDGLAITFPRAE